MLSLKQAEDIDDGTQLAAQAQEAIAQLAQVIGESAQMAVQMSTARSLTQIVEQYQA